MRPGAGRGGSDGRRAIGLLVIGQGQGLGEQGKAALGQTRCGIGQGRRRANRRERPGGEGQRDQAAKNRHAIVP